MDARSARSRSGTVPPQLPFTESDLELAVELGRRASAALDNALLYREVGARAHAAEALEFVDDGVILVDTRRHRPAVEPGGRDDLPGEEPARAVGRPVENVIADWDTLSERLTPPGNRPRARAAPETLPIDVQEYERWLSISAVRFIGGTVYAFRDLTEARAVDQLKSDFVSTVSHELRHRSPAIYGAAPHAAAQRRATRRVATDRASRRDLE